MDLFSKNSIKRLLKQHKVFPKKRFGQNFLIDRKVLKKIIMAAGLPAQSGSRLSGRKNIILEIGPGIGNLTRELSTRAKEVIAVEKDSQMIKVLEETTKNLKNVKIIQGDILSFSSYKLPTTRQKRGSPWAANYKLIGNLPYYIVSPVIRKFLELSEAKPRIMVLMVQKEVAQRICAKPLRPLFWDSAYVDDRQRRQKRVSGQIKQKGVNGQVKMSLLSVSVQFYAKPEIISFVSKKSFWPSPKVDGAILKIIPRLPRTEAKLLVRGRSAPARQRLSVAMASGSASFRELFFRIAKAGFSQPRKQIINNLSHLRQGYGGQVENLKISRERVKAWLLKNKIQPDQRAETLSIENWIKLAKTFDLD